MQTIHSLPQMHTFCNAPEEKGIKTCTRLKNKKLCRWLTSDHILIVSPSGLCDCHPRTRLYSCAFTLPCGKLGNGMSSVSTDSEFGWSRWREEGGREEAADVYSSLMGFYTSAEVLVQGWWGAAQGSRRYAGFREQYRLLCFTSFLWWTPFRFHVCGHSVVHHASIHFPGNMWFNQFKQAKQICDKIAGMQSWAVADAAQTWRRSSL